MCVDDEPHPTDTAKARITIGTLSTGRRLRFRAQNHTEPKNMSVHTSSSGPDGNVATGAVIPLTGAVVPTLTVTVWVALPPIDTDELDKPQVGDGVTVGVTPQLKLTVPLNDATDAKSRLKSAVCPALMVRDVGEGAIVKSGSA